MDWSKNAAEITERQESRRVFQLALAASEGTEDAEWLNRQLDLCCEGRPVVEDPRVGMRSLTR